MIKRMFGFFADEACGGIFTGIDVPVNDAALVVPASQHESIFAKRIECDPAPESLEAFATANRFRWPDAATQPSMAPRESIATV